MLYDWLREGGVLPCKKEEIVLGRQANLKETSEGKELAELRLQVLEVVKTSDACESKKEIMRLKVGSTNEGP